MRPELGGKWGMFQVCGTAKATGGPGENGVGLEIGLLCTWAPPLWVEWNETFWLVDAYERLVTENSAGAI